MQQGRHPRTCANFASSDAISGTGAKLPGSCMAGSTQLQRPPSVDVAFLTGQSVQVVFFLPSQLLTNGAHLS